jgi:hypothetical protein
VQLTNKKKEKMKEKKTLKSLAFVRSNKHTCDIHKQSNLSLALSFSAQTAKRRRRENEEEEEEISRKERCLDDEDEWLRPVTIGWCEQ